MTKQSKEQKNENVQVDHLEHIKTLPTVSAQIRYLAANGFERGKIAKLLGKRYQHVRNVLEMPVKTPKV